MSPTSQGLLPHLIEIGKAARSNVAFFDLSDRTQIEITGSDRSRFLHGFTSNDIKRLKPGEGCEAFVTNVKGKIVAHVFVFCTENALWLDGTPGQQDAIMTHLGKYVLIDDVQLIPRGADRGELFVTGPFAAGLLQLDDQLKPCSHVTRETDGEPFQIRRVDLLGEPGFLLSIPRSRLGTVKSSLIGLGVPEGSSEVFEALRIAAGFPRYGIDITEENLAQEAARTKQCISFDKGCYLGQETVARIDSLGHTNQELRRIRFATDAIPASGVFIYDESGTTEVGTVTSATIEPSLIDQAVPDAKIAATTLSQAQPDRAPTYTVIALGHLKSSVLKPNTAVSLKIGDKLVTGQVV